MAKIDIDKFICDYYEKKKQKLPYDVRSRKLETIERLLRSQNLEIRDGEIREISGNQGGISPNDDKSIKVELGTDLYIPSEFVSAFMQDERKGWFMLSKHAAIIFGLTEKEMGIIMKIVKSWKKCDTNNESKSGAT